MRRMILAAAAAVLTTACVRTAVDPVTGNVDLDVESPTKQGEEWTAEIAGQGSAASLTGTAVARVIAGTTTTTVNIRGATPGARIPWHVHTGNCGTGGPIYGPATAYPTIVVGADGTGTASAQIQLQLNEAERYHVNLHESPTNMPTIIACGQLDD